MKNTWLHSILIILAGTAVLVALHVLSVSLIGPNIINGYSDLDSFGTLVHEPLSMLERLVPGLGMGWLTRRHPLVLGAIAGGLASYLIPVALGYRLFPFAQAGDAISLAMLVSVSVLAGRALRCRFQP